MSEKTCLAAPKVCRPICGIRRLHRETFLQVHVLIPRHPTQGYAHHGAIQMQEEFETQPVRGSLYLKMVMVEKAQHKLRDS